MFELKSISKQAVASALEKAVRYRVLNEPVEAESICRDVLEVQPDNQEAIATLLLAVTDQFPHGLAKREGEARELVPRLRSDYEQAYYAGIISERRAKYQYQRGTAACGPLAYHALREAMEFYEKAEAVKPFGKDDAVLRWNACARLIMRHRDIAPAAALETETPLQLE